MAGRRDPERYESMRKSVLEAAVSVFQTKGYESARLEDIADVLGVTKASVYYYFQKKSDLLAEMCALAVEEALARQTRILAQDIPADDRLREVMADQLRGMSTNFAVWNIFFRQLTVEHPDDPRWKTIRLGMREYGKHFEDLLEEGVRTGVMRPVNARITAFAILGMLNWSSRWIQHEDIALVTDEVLQLVTVGVLPA
jgi:TetR/AcrR family transcriptional regulator, cholesterol catabolism regulator